MATVNVQITGDWTLVAEAADDPVLITGVVMDPVEVAVSDGAPTVPYGHRLERMASGDGITRELIGAGDIYARLSGNRPGPATLVVTK